MGDSSNNSDAFDMCKKKLLTIIMIIFKFRHSPILFCFKDKNNNTVELISITDE